MKAKKLMGMIACAGACVSLSAFGNTTNGWFGVTVGTDITPVNCATNGVAVTVANNKIVLDNDKTSPLTITPNASFTATNRNDGVYVIQATAALTPCSASDLTDNVTGDAKAGFAVGIDNNNVTNYYGYAKGNWNPYNGVPVVAEGQDTTFKIVLNYRDGKVQFYVGTNPETMLGEVSDIDFGTSAPIGIDAFGSGSISSITSGYEVAVCAIANGNKYGSVSDAITAGGTTGTIQYINNSGTPISATAANGLDAATCIALGVDPTSETAKVRFVPAYSDTDANNVTLKVNSDSIDTGLYVTYTVSAVSGGSESTQQQSNDGTVKIPTTTGVYTITPTSVSTTEN